MKSNEASLSAAQFIALGHLRAGMSAEETAVRMGLTAGAVRLIWEETAEYLGARSLEQLRKLAAGHLSAEWS